MDADLKSRLERRQAVLDRVRNLLVEKLNLRLAPADIDPDVPIFTSGLALDSVDAVELVIHLEDLGLKLADDTVAVPALRTVNTIVDAVLALREGEVTRGA